MIKNNEILEKRREAIYNEVKQAKRNGEKVEPVLQDIADRLYLSKQTVLNDYAAGIKQRGRIY